MLKFSPCLDIFFKDLPFAERVEKIASIGYRNYEFWVWWEKNMDEVKEVTEKHDMNLVAFCTKFVSLVDASKRQEYLDGLGETIETAKKTNTRIIISQVGNELEGVSRDVQKQSLVDGLKESAKLLKGTGKVLAIEPLNLLYDHAGYFLARSDEATEILREVNSPDVKMLFDIYHQQITEGNLINNIKDYIDLIAHFHVADHPGRKEIGSGEINYPNIFETIDSLNYKGYVGIELFPENKNHEVVLKNSIFF